MASGLPTEGATGGACWSRAGHVRYAALTPPCEPVPRPLMVAHAFSVSELTVAVSKPEVNVIVHRGRFHEIPRFRPVSSHTELGVVWTSRASGIAAVASRELLASLDAEAQIGGKEGPKWQIFCHVGELNRRALRTALRLKRQIEPRKSSVQLLANYRELAEAARLFPHALVLGLRGEAASDPALRIVAIDGCRPIDPEQCRRYPFQYRVHCYVRLGLPSDLECLALNHLAEVARRVSFDERILLGARPTERESAPPGRAA